MKIKIDYNHESAIDAPRFGPCIVGGIPVSLARFLSLAGHSEPYEYVGAGNEPDVVVHPIANGNWAIATSGLPK